VEDWQIATHRGTKDAKDSIGIWQQHSLLSWEGLKPESKMEKMETQALIKKIQ